MAIKLESLAELTSWETYRLFMKERLKQLPSEEGPFYLTKKKLDFDFDGKPWKGHAILVGKKGELAAKKIKKQGTQFFIGTCLPNGKEFEVEGIDPAFLKRAHLTLKKLRLGYSIAGISDDEAEEGEAEESSDRGPRRSPAGAPLARAPEVWTMSRRFVVGKTDQLKAAIRKTVAGQGREALAEVEATLKSIDRVLSTLDAELGKILARAGKARDAASRDAELKAARALLAKHIRYVTTDPLIKHIDSNPFGVQTNLQATLTKALKQVAQTIAAATG